jgi:transposase-like protein
MARRSEERTAHWREVVSRQAASGLTVAAFCREASISAPTFYFWRRRLQDASASPAPRPAAERGVQAGFVPVRVAAAASPTALRIYLPRGVCLELPQGLADLGPALRAVREAELC